MAFINRLKEARVKKKMTQSELGLAIGVSKATISSYESGNSDPDILKIQNMMKVLDIDANFLWQDEMKKVDGEFTPWHQSLTTAYEAAEIPVRQSACRVLDIDYVDPDKRYLKTFALAPDPREEKMEGIRTLTISAAAGSGNGVVHEYELQSYPSSVIPSKTDWAVTISGDSMEPRIHDGDVVFVQESQEIFNHQIGIFLINGDEAVCKRAKFDDRGRLIWLMSDNPQIADIRVSELNDCRVFGRVLGVYRD